MLKPEAREGMRQAAEHVSSVLSDEDREEVGQRAHKIIDHLHEDFDDDAAANAAYMLGAVLAALRSMPLRHVNETIEGTIDTYLLAAGALAGVYTLPERKDEEPEPKGPAPELAPEWQERADSAQSPGTGFYL
jgi:hypothetical protein